MRTILMTRDCETAGHETRDCGTARRLIEQLHTKITIMKAFVNDTEVRTYYGAKVKSVVLAYCRANNLPLNLNGIVVKDAYGNIVDLDGSLRANSKIFINL